MQLMMLSIVLLTLPIAAFAIPLYLFATIEISLKFGVLRKRSISK